MSNALPYPDTKAVGAADFYFGINATFRFIGDRFGLKGLRRYWQEIGQSYFQPVTVRWAEGGLPAVAEYWRAFFAAEPGAEVDVTETADKVTLSVRRCPAVSHLRMHGRAIVPEFCQQCYFVSKAMGAGANVAVRVCGGNGTCTQEFTTPKNATPQDLNQITLCS